MDILRLMSTVSHLKTTQISRSDGELVQAVSDTFVFEKEASDGPEPLQTDEILLAETPDDGTGYLYDPRDVIITSISTGGSSGDVEWSGGFDTDFIF